MVKYMKLKLVAAIGVSALLLFGCNTEGDRAETNDELLQEEVDIKQLVHEYSIGIAGEGEHASIRSYELIVTHSDNTETIYQLPEEEFFVSIAPFVYETHP